jgi:hypothetical protein
MCKILVGEPEGKGPVGRPKHSWVSIIKMDLIMWWYEL